MAQRSLYVAQILWPAFLFAGVLEMLVFAWVDPALIEIGRWHPDANTVYSLTFLAFWGLIAAAIAVSHWLVRNEAAVAGRVQRRLRRARHAHAAGRF